VDVISFMWASVTLGCKLFMLLAMNRKQGIL